jgi:hypothetical protein
MGNKEVSDYRRQLTMKEKRKLAVTPKGYDDIGKVLEGMGAGYEYTPKKRKISARLTRMRRRRYTVILFQMG